MSTTSTDKYLTYRGDLKAAVSIGQTVLFVTAHPEGQPTALYRLDADKFTLAEDALPAGGVDLVSDGDTVWVAGTDRRVYRAPAGGGKVTAFGPQLDAPPVALARVSDNRLAVLAGQQLLVLAGKDGKAVQSLDLPEPGTALVADPGGNWLVAGTNKGTVLVFDCEDKPDRQFLLGESAKLHEGAVTALLFEADELRFLSAGADGKLLLTHARGKLEPEDKGRGNSHADRVAAMAWSPLGDRLLTGGKDSTVKNWPRVGATKPATLKDGVAKVVDLATAAVHNRSYLVVACEDATIRLFPIDAAGKLGDLSHRVHGAVAWVKHELTQNEPKRREAALRTLAAWADTPSIELLAQQVSADADHALRLLAAQLLSDSGHPRAAKLLEKGLTHNDEAVRVAALTGLRKHLGEADLRPLDLALAAEKADVGRLAVQALQTLAARDDQALARLVKALDAKTFEVRVEALTALEHVHGAKSPDASLTALGSKHADVRGIALYRLHQRKLLDEARVQAALRRAGEDADAGVRKVAFLVSLYTRPALATAMRGRDPELERQLVELETIGQDAKPGDKKEAKAAEPKETKEAKPKPAVKKTAAGPKLDEPDYDPLLQATASRALDTCLRGARGLAVLGDERALGLLLQLSREQDAAARVEVARALAALDDPRSAGRLRSLLFDADAAVRDAAFTALEKLNEADPLAAADAGLGATFEDVRRRGLQAVIAAARTKKPETADDPAWRLLIRALNDAAPAVRSEAFKSALNLKIGGGGVNTLRFVLQSVHADVRREVLTEVMAQSGDPAQQADRNGWAWGLLLEFYNDPDPKLREEAFEFATKGVATRKTRDLEPLEAALRSRYADVRKRAVEALVKKHSKAAQALLAGAVSDEDRSVRLTALDALIGDDVRDALHGALRSPHDDVHARAAKALARHGDAGALKPLVDLVTAPEPEPAERKAEWAKLLDTALDGLALLGDPGSLPHITPLLNSTNADVRKAAAMALAWVAIDRHPDSLRQAMQHADPQVRHHAALGLALGGEASAAPLVFSTDAAKVLSIKDRIVAALALGPAGEDHLVAFLDHTSDQARAHALLILMLLELKSDAGVPTRCLAALASREPRVRLRAARGLDSFREPGLFLPFVASLFNDRGFKDEGGVYGDKPEKPWNVPTETVNAVADLIAAGSPQAKARTARLLSRVLEKEQSGWDHAWAVHERRFAAEVDALRAAAAKRKPAAPQYTPQQLEELAFGAYVGLVREQGGSYSAKDRPAYEPQIVRVRQTALTWVQELAKRDAAAYAKPAQSVFVQALGDPYQPVRMQAFEQLQALGMDATALGAEALEAGHTDLGVRGLELLSGGAGGGTAGGKTSAKGQAVLESAMLSRTDALAVEAGKLLIGVRGAAATAAAALAAAYEPLRRQAVDWLAAAYETDPAAQTALRGALTSRYAAVREAAALALARKRDPAAFPALVTLLGAAVQPAPQTTIINALVEFGDVNRVPDALLDRLENDPGGTAQSDLLIASAGRFHPPQTADRIIGLMDKNPKWRKAAFRAALMVSGHDQGIEDPEDERPTDRRWMEKQYQRHDDVLARLMDKAIDLNETALLSGVVRAARWAQSPAVDPPLARLTAHPDENLRRAAVEAVSWRLRKRGGPADRLLQALGHKDPQTQFLAAEGLARGGRGEGLSVLLSAVDFMTDLSLRQRAVRAMGELGDARALDTLLRLANESGHALQQEAAEALGHLGRSGAADEIFKLLERFARGTGPVAANALRGLRWLDTPAGWRVVRDRAADDNFAGRDAAVELLGYNDDPATRDLLLRLLIEAGDIDTGPVLASARRLFGPDSLEPDYALLRAEYVDGDDRDVQEALRRVRERGEPRRVFEVLTAAHDDDVKDALSVALLNHTPLPVKEAEAALPANDPAAVRVAARVIGRAGGASKDAAAALRAALDRWRKAWDERRRTWMPGYEGQEDDELTGRLTPALQSLLWAAGRLGLAHDETIAAAGANADDRQYRPVRLEAVSALASAVTSSGKVPPAVVAALEVAATGDDSQTRALAADALARSEPGRAGKLAGRILADRVSFNRLAENLRKSDGGKGDGLVKELRAAGTQPHYQGIALPHLIARGDVEALTTAATNRDLPRATRLGAVEALGKLATGAAEDRLRLIGAADKDDEEVRKAAWRALRRSKRARQEAAESPAR